VASATAAREQGTSADTLRHPLQWPNHRDSARARSGIFSLGQRHARMNATRTVPPAIMSMGIRVSCLLRKGQPRAGRACQHWPALWLALGAAPLCAPPCCCQFSRLAPTPAARTPLGGICPEHGSCHRPDGLRSRWLNSRFCTSEHCKPRLLPNQMVCQLAQGAHCADLRGTTRNEKKILIARPALARVSNQRAASHP
jgi:hypothetical protein